MKPIDYLTGMNWVGQYQDALRNPDTMDIRYPTIKYAVAQCRWKILFKSIYWEGTEQRFSVWSVRDMMIYYKTNVLSENG